MAGREIRRQKQTCDPCLESGRRPPPINRSHDLLDPPNPIIDCAHGCRNLLPAYCASFRAAKIGAAISRKTGGERVRCTACCIATEVFFANGGAVSRLRCRSKVAQEAAFALVECSDQPYPPAGQTPAESALLALGRELRHEEIHLVFDSIANVTADHSHTIQPG